jgi:hypothetical protein
LWQIYQEAHKNKGAVAFEDEELFGRLGKKTVGLQKVKENRIVGSSIGLREVGDWTFWKVRPPPKRKKAQTRAGNPESFETLIAYFSS